MVQLNITHAHQKRQVNWSPARLTGVGGPKATCQLVIVQHTSVMDQESFLPWQDKNQCCDLSILRRPRYLLSNRRTMVVSRCSEAAPTRPTIGVQVEALPRLCTCSRNSLSVTNVTQREVEVLGQDEAFVSGGLSRALPHAFSLYPQPLRCAHWPTVWRRRELPHHRALFLHLEPGCVETAPSSFFSQRVSPPVHGSPFLFLQAARVQWDSR